MKKLFSICTVLGLLVAFNGFAQTAPATTTTKSKTSQTTVSETPKKGGKHHKMKHKHTAKTSTSTTK